MFDVPWGLLYPRVVNVFCIFFYFFKIVLVSTFSTWIHLEFILVNGVGCGWSSRSAVYIFECSNCQVCMIFVRKSHEDFEKILREWRSRGGKVNWQEKETVACGIDLGHNGSRWGQRQKESPWLTLCPGSCNNSGSTWNILNKQNVNFRVQEQENKPEWIRDWSLQNF